MSPDFSSGSMLRTAGINGSREASLLLVAFSTMMAIEAALKFCLYSRLPSMLTNTSNCCETIKRSSAPIVNQDSHRCGQQLMRWQSPEIAPPAHAEPWENHQESCRW